jgi:hypothetical protein
MTGRNEPLRRNEGGATLEISFLIESGLPGPGTRGRIRSTHDPSRIFTIAKMALKQFRRPDKIFKNRKMKGSAH